MPLWPTVVHTGEVLVGGTWLVTGFTGPDPRRFAQQLRRAGFNPHAAAPAIWLQRGAGALLLALGVLGFLHARA
jgi:hypothetical protein